MASIQPILYSFPPEILNGIISLLDPISLIAFSQVSKSLRQYVDPTEFDFQQRLFALELLPKYGSPDPRPMGMSYHIMYRHIRSFTHRSRSWWANNKYACCGCMKILPNFMFEDGDLFNTTTRKPEKSFAEFNRMMSNKEERMELIQKQMARYTMVIKEHEERYDAVYDVEQESDEPDINVIRKTVEFIVGAACYERRCIECKYQKKLLVSKGFLCGHPKAPIVTCGDTSSMWIDCNWLFPGLLPRVPVNEEIKVGVLDWLVIVGDDGVYDQEIYRDFERVLRIRCSGCEKWQRSRAFGMTLVDSPERAEWWPQNFSPHLSPSALKMGSKSSLCHHCHAKTHGKAETATRLVNVALPTLKQEIYATLSELWKVWDVRVQLIRNLLVDKGEKETWKKIATLSADPRCPIPLGVGNNLDWWQLEKDLSETKWRDAGSGRSNVTKPIDLEDLPILLARKRLVEQSLSWVLENLAAHKLPCNDGDSSNDTYTGNDIRNKPRFYSNILDGLVQFLDEYDVRHQAIIDMQAAYHSLLKAESTQDYQFLLSALMPPDEYGRNL